jgi:O-antigen ligase
MRQWDEIGVIGNFTLHVTDLLFALTMIHCSASALWRWRYSPLEYLNLLLCGILVVNFARGIAAVGVASAGVQFRNVAGFVAASLFVFFMHRRTDIDWVLDKVVLLGWGIVLLSFARLAFGLDVFIAPEVGYDPEVLGARTLHSGAALMLGEACLIVLNRVGALPVGLKRRRMTTIFLIFFAIVLISNQRTAITATLTGIGVLVAAFPRQRRRVIFPVGGFVIVTAGAVVYGAWIAAGGDITSFLPEQSVAETDYAWRLEQWQEYVDVYWQAGLVDQIIGMPLSLVQSMAFRLDLDRLQFVPHSEYVMLLINSGLIGAMLFGLMFVVAVGKGIMIMRRETGGNTRSNNVGLAIAIIVSHAVFSYAYVIPNEQGLLLAVALQVIATAPGFASRPVLFRRSLPGWRTERLGAGVGADALASSQATPSDSRAAL